MFFNSHHTLDSAQIQELTLNLMLSRINQEKRDEFRVLLGVLTYAACAKISVHEAGRSLQKAPHGRTVRDKIADEFEDIEKSEKMFNALLRELLPKRLRSRQRRHIAVDLHEQPYYGELPDDDKGEIRVGQKVKKTRKHFTYATAYLAHKGVRYTLALTRVKAGETMEVVLKRLMRYMRAVKFAPSLVMLDRGFYTTPVMRYLTRRKTPFIIPAIKRGRRAKHPDGPSGLYIYEEKPKGWYRHTLNKKHKKGRRRKLVIDIAVLREARKTPKGRILKLFVYATWGVRHRSMGWIRKTYQTRFGIETSFRQGNQARIKTCTKKAHLRFVFFGLSVLLRQMWVWLHDEVIAQKRQGARKWNMQALTFAQLLCWVRKTLEELYELIEEISVGENLMKVWEEFESLEFVPHRKPR